MNGAFAKIVVFGLANLALFVYMGEAITRLSGTGAGGPVVSGEISPEAGEALFLGKGKCYTCHAIGGEGSAVRCPNLGVLGDTFPEPVAVRAAARRADQGYSATDYLLESLYDPNAYVVQGYPKNLMTPIHRPPIMLADEEIASVVLYLLDRGGVDMDDHTLAEVQTAQRRFAAAAPEAAGAGPQLAFPEGDAEDGWDAFAEMRCYQCHRVDGVAIDVDESVEGGIGPDLTSIGAIQTPLYLAESILSPNAVIVADPPGATPGSKESYRTEEGGSKMPEYHDTMTLRYLANIVAFMSELQGKEANETQFGG